ncbi:hypothetical protein SUDANB150_00699 [Streptomyces sp. enrichment culture]
MATETVDHQLDASTLDGELTSKPADFYTYQGESREIAAAPSMRLDAKSLERRSEVSRSAYEQDVDVPSSSPYYAIDNTPVAGTTTYLPRGQRDWEEAGAPYQPKDGETVRTTAPAKGATLYDVAKGRISLERFVSGLSLEQLAHLVEGTTTPGSTPVAAGAGGYTTGRLEKLGVPSMSVADGPAGPRLTQKIDTDPPTYQWNTAWPVETMIAQPWNTDLVRRIDTAVGKEMTEYGVTIWLAPALNIHRDPLNGRNFEYYSEDPLLSGTVAAANTDGEQSQPGVGVVAKHFAANNQETSRDTSNSVVSERALREIELKGFEYLVKSAQPMTLMSAYNKINGTWTSKNYDLITDVLRGEWGYRGTIMSDWGGAHGAADTMYAGNDLIQPGDNPGEVVAASKKVQPPVDTTGLPQFTKKQVDLGDGRMRTLQYLWKSGSLVLDPDGAETVSTMVDSTTDLSRERLSTTSTYYLSTGKTEVVRDSPPESVDAAYKAVTSILADSVTDATTKAAVRVTDVVHSVPGDDSTPVVPYTVTVRGDYHVTMRLGDLQRSAMRILNTAMRSRPFAQLARAQGVRGIEVGPYTDRFFSPGEVLRSQPQLGAHSLTRGRDRLPKPVPPRRAGPSDDGTRPAARLLLAHGRQVFAQVGRRLDAFVRQEEVSDAYVLGTAQDCPVALEGAPVFDEAAQPVDAAQGVDEERVVAARHDGLVEPAVEVVQLGVADGVDLSVDQSLLLGSDGFEGVPVQDEAGFEDRGGFDGEPEAVAVLIGVHRGEHGLELPTVSGEPFDPALHRYATQDVGELSGWEGVAAGEGVLGDAVGEPAVEPVGRDAQIDVLGGVLGRRERGRLGQGRTRDGDGVAAPFGGGHYSFFRQQPQGLADR